MVGLSRTCVLVGTVGGAGEEMGHGEGEKGRGRVGGDEEGGSLGFPIYRL